MMRILSKVIVACALLLSVSCTKDYIGGPVETTRSIPVSLVLLGLDQSKPQSRAGDQIADDLKVVSMDLLLFDENNRFIKRVEIPDALLRQTLTGVNFTADLGITPKKRTIHFVANGRTANGEERVNFGDITVGMDMEAAMRALRTNPLPNETDPYGNPRWWYHVRPLVMWGQQTFPNGISSNTRIENLKLLRSVARIEVKVAEGLDFKLEGITLVNAVSSGFVTPEDLHRVETPEKPNPVPTSSFMHYLRGWFKTEGIGGLAKPDQTERWCWMYAYDQSSADPQRAPMVLIRGTVKIPKPYPPGQLPCPGASDYYEVYNWWKIALVDEKGNMLDIVRNHKYVLTITEVTNQGYPSEELAIENPPVGLKVTINDETTEYPIVVADGTDYMGVTNDWTMAYVPKPSANSGSTNSSDEGYYPITLCQIYLSKPIPVDPGYDGIDVYCKGNVLTEDGRPMVRTWSNGPEVGTVSKLDDSGQRFRIGLYVRPVGPTMPEHPAEIQIVAGTLKASVYVGASYHGQFAGSPDADEDSFVIPLLRPGNGLFSGPFKYWDVKESGVRPLVQSLSNVYSRPQDYPAKAAEMTTDHLSSKYDRDAYLHVLLPKSGDGFGEFYMSLGDENNEGHVVQGFVRCPDGPRTSSR